MTDIRIAGIDYSMTCPCVAIYTGDLEKDTLKFEDVSFYALMEKPPKTKARKNKSTKNWSTKHLKNVTIDKLDTWEDNTHRFDEISNWALKQIEYHGVQIARLEDYAYGGRGKNFHIGENAGILKLKLRHAGIPVQVIPPTVVKKDATSKGNASKGEMYYAFKRYNDVKLNKIYWPKLETVGKSPVSDIVDAYFIVKGLYDDLKKAAQESGS